MRPVLVQLGPWDPWVIAVLAGLLGVLFGTWFWLESWRQPGQRLRPLDVGLGAALALGGAVVLYFLVNRFGPVPIRSYGVMLLAGLAAGAAWLAHNARHYDLPSGLAVDLALAALVGGILGARLLYVLLDLPQFAGNPLSAFRVWEGGLSFHGGLAGGLLAAYLLARRRRLHFPTLLDAGAPAIALGYALARIGCFLNGCCFGGHCQSFWGVRFAPGSEAAAWSLGLPPGQPATTWGEPLYPAQLLASFLAIVIFFILVLMRRLFARPGHLFMFFLALYGVERFVVEFWRHGASGRPFALLPALTVAQVASLVLTAGAVVFLVTTWPRNRARGTSQASSMASKLAKPKGV